MNHDQLEEQLLLSQTGELPRPKAQELQAYLATHPDEAEQAREVDAILSLYKTSRELPQISESTILRIMEEARQNPPRPPHPANRWLTVAIAVVAGLILALVLYILLG